MFKKYEDHTMVAYKAGKLTATESMSIVMDVVEGGFYHGPVKVEMQKEGDCVVYEISFRCTKKEFKCIEGILYSMRRDSKVKLGVMTLV